VDIATIVATHSNPETTIDTIESVRYHMTDKVILLVDEVGWHEYKELKVPASKLKGFRHGFFRAPYRNVMLSLKNAAKTYPSVDWYCYLEYDCLIGSSDFKQDLAKAEAENVWMLGNDLRRHEEKKVKFPLIELMFKTKFDEILYFLGAMLFFHKKFIDKCVAENFFERFLYLTNDFKDGFFPDYEGKAAWDLSEHLLPTLAKHWGGNVKQFASYDKERGLWSGDYKRYLVRWTPPLYLTDEEIESGWIYHPVKDYNDPIREYHREKRNECN
jgi:hypothetical protein